MQLKEIAEKLLFPLWLGIPNGYKSRYRQTIWQQFENQIRASAYTSSVSRWNDDFQRRLQIELRAGDVAKVAEVLAVGDSLLKTLREDAATLTLYVRLLNEERGEKAKARIKQREAEAALFGGGNENESL